MSRDYGKDYRQSFRCDKKIVRAVFRGSPNLITTADLNRQFAALKYQMDQLDDKTGVISDLSVTVTPGVGAITVEFTYTYMEVKGCSFTPETKTLTANFMAQRPTAYLCLVADKGTVTYDDDFSHEISGAKFADGKTYAAADHIVYKNEDVVLVNSLNSLDNLVAVLGVFNYTGTKLRTNKSMYTYMSNCMEKNKSLSMDVSLPKQVVRDDFNIGNIGADIDVTVNVPLERGYILLVGVRTGPIPVSGYRPILSGGATAIMFTDNLLDGLTTYFNFNQIGEDYACCVELAFSNDEGSLHVRTNGITYNSHTGNTTIGANLWLSPVVMIPAYSLIR